MTIDRRSKLKWGLRLKLQIKRVRQQAKQNIKKFTDETEKARQVELKES